MALAKIVYASMSVNTENEANILADALKAEGLEVEVNECQSVEASDFQSADICIVATYTWGDGELPDEIINFYDELQELDLSGKIYGVIGTGDTAYDQFCQSVDDFVTAFSKTGAVQGAESVKIENDADDADIEALHSFAKNIKSSLN